MAVSGYMYPRAEETAWKAEWDFVDDTIKMALVKPAYTPADTHDYWDDVTANECSGTGYTAKGDALTTKAVTFVDDSSVTAWATGTAYAVGDLVRPTSADGHIYMCVVAGTSHATTEPTWDTTPGQDSPSDNGVIWSEVGRGFVKISSDTVDFGTIDLSGAGNGCQYGVIFKDTGVNSTSPLICLIDFGTEENPDGTFQVIPASDGWAASFAGFGGT